MCGILCICNSPSENSHETRKRALILRRRIQHRGMDESGIREIQQGENTHFFCHERLSIVDPRSGSQPITNEDDTITICVNGEIYNHKLLRDMLTKDHILKTNSDCEIIIHLYEEFGPDCVRLLIGDYAFVLHDSKTNTVFAARDPVGVVPLYYGYGRDGSMWFSNLERFMCPELRTIIWNLIVSTDGTTQLITTLSQQPKFPSRNSTRNLQNPYKGD
jgi:asparagine synthase (glutamine-hydrolysing)